MEYYPSLTTSYTVTSVLSIDGCTSYAMGGFLLLIDSIDSPTCLGFVK
ncbi:MAG: hypothetical protein PHP52_02045 [Bacteroidales bacterium]|nr:hypothetical protein [Bacteroidales bacterium]